MDAESERPDAADPGLAARLDRAARSRGPAVQMPRKDRVERPAPPVPREERAAQTANPLPTALEAHRAGDFDQAERLYRMVLHREPGDAIALNNLGVLLVQRGRRERGEELVRKALAVKPDYAVAHSNLGTLLREKGDIDAAIAAFEQAVAAKPDYAEAHFSLALAYVKQGSIDEAVTAFDHAIANRPAYPEAHFHRANNLKKKGELDKAIAAYREATALKPDFGDAYANLGVALAEASELDEAATAYRRALEIKPGNHAAHANLGNVLVGKGDVDAAIAEYRRALAIAPDWAHARFALSLALLQKGEFAEGWRQYEWRWKGAVEKIKPRELPKPQWQGEDLAGKTLLIYAEQGLGDTLQFVRFLPGLAARGARVVLEVPGRLLALLRMADVAETLVAAGTGLPEFDFHLPLLSLPSVIGLTEEGIPAEMPYLAADPARVARWRERLPQTGFRVGVAWQGFPNAAIDKGRSIPLRCFAPLAAVPQVRLISLQKNYGLDQLDALPEGMRVETLGADFDAGPDAFLDTAAVMADLDLLITSDTSIAHLAGALGRPFWLVLQANPDWRWLIGREDSPWYPTARLFRQKKRGDWDEVMQRVAAELAQVTAGNLEKLFAPGQAVAADGRVDRARAAFERGFARHRDDSLEAAAAAYCKAVMLDPNHAEAHSNLGVIRHGSGRVDEAITLYRRAVAIKPDHVSALGNLAVALTANGDVEGAVAALRQLVAARPEDAEGHLKLGDLLRRNGDIDGAIDAYRQAVAARPDDPKAHFSLARGRQTKGDLDLAIEGYRRAIALDPGLAAAHTNLGFALSDTGHVEEWIAECRQALALQPDNPQYHANLALGRQTKGDLDAAIEGYRRAIALDQRLAAAHANLGMALLGKGQVAEAIPACRRAIELEPDNANYHFNLSHSLLVSGNYPEGWQEYEWRLKTAQLTPMSFSQPVWTGEETGGRTLLLVHEQGFGDTLQFCRYATLAAARGRVILGAPRPLVRLLGSLDGVERVVSDGDKLPPFDLYCPLASLPRAFNTTLGTIPAKVPYLAADAGQVASWKRRVESLAGLRVGLVWAGNSRPNLPGANAIDRRRSITLAHFGTLAELPGVSFVSLQKGAPASQARSPPPGLVLHDWTDELDDFADTAALIEALDLVISVDTSVVHLAGALGKPVWILSRFDGCWRWLSDRDDSPWYPTARLFRQREPGDWDEVLQRVAAALTQVISGAREGLSPAGRSEPIGNALDRARAAFERGFALQRNGSLDAAAAAYGEAITLAPNHAEAHSNLGVIRHGSGRIDEAIALYRRAVAIKPDHVAALGNLAVALTANGDLDGAIAALRRVVATRPEAAESHLQLGDLLRRNGDTDGAVDAYRQAAVLRPDDPKVQFGLALSLQTKGELEAAIGGYRRAVALDPGLAQAHANLGVALSDADRVEEGIAECRQALALQADNPQYHSNLGLALSKADDLDGALAHYRRAVEIDPFYAEAHANLALALMEKGLVEEAIACDRRAILLKPDYAVAHFNLSLALLLNGEFAAAWQEYEWRWKGGVKDLKAAEFAQPQWQGEDLAGKTLLLTAEQGLGDMLQFARFAAALAARGARIILAAPRGLVTLLRSTPGVEAVVGNGDKLPRFDVHRPLMSVPVVLGTTEATIPANVPYLAADPERVALWRARLPADEFKVGIVWQGRPDVKIDKGRSVPLRAFAPLAAVPGVHLVSLQKNHGLDQLEGLPEGMRVETLGGDFDAGPDAFLDTAAVMASLDLVITSDTSAAHLAGALGRPVWVVLKSNPDWRWLIGREDSPWYPTARLFRQRQPGDWGEVFARVAKELARIASGERDAGVPASLEPSPMDEPMLVPVVVGELADKITILEIKAARITDAAKLRNVRFELDQLRAVWDRRGVRSAALEALTRALKQTNESLWAIEDAIRDCERQRDFGRQFVELARAVYRTNDRRAEIKREINLAAGSAIIEEKSYRNHSSEAVGPPMRPAEGGRRMQGPQSKCR